jgi:hypothetical protein
VSRLAITAVAMVFVAAMWFATIYVALTKGVDLLTVIGVLVVSVLSFGIFGALSEPPDRRRRP